MKTATLNLHPSFNKGRVSPYIFGGFLEHMGRCVYEGVYDPQSEFADEYGYRTDVLDALRGLQMTMMRYPGGNFVSDYHWQDGVGPADSRPTLKNLAWQSLESNQFGTNEFLQLCQMMDWEPMLAANLGTGTPEEARNWVEYCNGTTPTHWPDLRRAHGLPDPHNVRYWCLGNEMDGPWQTGHMPAEQYGIKARQAAAMMKGADRGLQMVVCGSSATEMPTYLEWDRTALESVGGLGHYISLHRYVGNDADDAPSYLATGLSIDAQIEAVDAVCRYVQSRRRSPRRAYLCFDEWNVWYKARTPAEMDGGQSFAPHLIEEVYNLEDALVVAQFLNSFIRHADVLKIANIAQIVNVIAPILTNETGLLKQTIYYIFQLFSQQKDGTALQVQLDCEHYSTDTFDEVPYLDTTAIHNQQANTLTAFVVNRSTSDHMPLDILANGITLSALDDGQVIQGASLKTENTFASPNEILPAPFDEVQLTATGARTRIPPASFVRLVFRT